MRIGRDSDENNGAITPKSDKYIAEVSNKLRDMCPLSIIQRVEELVQEHDEWRGQVCLNMNAAEGIMSPRSRRVLISDMATRVGEGPPGDKIFPHHAQTRFADEIEATVIALVRKQFGATYVEWRPTSTSMANTVVYFSLLNHDDVMLVQDMDGGGNYAYQKSGPAGLRTANIYTIPPVGRTFEIDLDQVKAAAKRLRPKMIVVGGGKVLFPYPLPALREIADGIGAIILYDAAHLGLLISSGEFQKPLEEGAHVVTVGTHKNMGGPVGGLVLTNDVAISAKVTSLTFPGVLQTRDQSKFAAFAITLAEHLSFGSELARNMVANARALGGALATRGFSVIQRAGVFTNTHQIFLELGDEAQLFERRWNDANILIPDCALTGDSLRHRRSGARIATHELARLGMGEAEMETVATLMARAVSPSANRTKVASDVRDFRLSFPGIPFSFT
jgi:glycine hydroxymethyltransferase